MEKIKSIQADSITITKSEDIIIEKKEIKDKIDFLKGDINNLQLALDGRKNDLLYYKGLLDQIPEKKVEPIKDILLKEEIIN